MRRKHARRSPPLLLVLALIAQLLPGASLTARADQTAAPAPYDGYLVHVSGSYVPETWEPVGEDLYWTDDADSAAALVLVGAADYAEPNYILTVQDLPWEQEAVRAPEAWSHTDEAGRADRLGDGVTIAIIDSGVLREHPDLDAGSILETYAPLGTAGGVDSWHGTFVAGLLAAQPDNGIGIDGLTPHVTILPICATKGDSTDIKTVSACLDYAVEQGADVINISISGDNPSETLQAACDRAAEAGVIVVSAAGNYTAGRTKSADRYRYPAGFDSVVGVSGCRWDGTAPVFDEDYSYFNDQVTVSAPGTEITSLYLDGGTAVRTGTSFSAPIVAAMAVMAKQADPSLDLGAFVSLLQESSVDLGESGYDVRYGWGFADIGAFLTALDARTAAGDEPEPTDEPAPTDEPTPTDEPEPTDEPAPTDEPEPDPLEAFTDLAADRWYSDSVRWCLMRGVMGGVGGGAFDPGGTTTRAMIVTILHRLAGEPAGAPEADFSDVPAGRWYSAAIDWAAHGGVASGYGDRRFGPTDPITREQMAAILYRYAASMGYDVSASAEVSQFSDARLVSGWAKDAVAWCIGAGLLQGSSPDVLDPKSNATRAQIAAIIQRFCAFYDL